MAANESITDLKRRQIESEAGITASPSRFSATGRAGNEAASTATIPANAIALTDRVLVKAGSTRLLSYNIYNPNASVAFVQLFSAGTVGAVTLGTTVPLAWLAVPPVGVLDGFWATSEAFNAGLVMAATAGPQNNTLVAAGLSVSLQVV